MKRFLLDTHIFLWWISDNPKLYDAARKTISDPKNELYLSAASTWEMVNKSKLGKLSLTETPEAFIRKQLYFNNIKSLDITVEHTLAVSALPLVHNDPFDRLLIAQATLEGLVIITDDEWIRKYNITVL
jgi:PIN domain nuclease of toxin-antitoxin system